MKLIGCEVSNDAHAEDNQDRCASRWGIRFITRIRLLFFGLRIRVRGKVHSVRNPKLKLKTQLLYLERIFVGSDRLVGDIVFNDHMDIIKARFESLERNQTRERNLLAVD